MASLSDVGILAMVPDAWHEGWDTRKQFLTRLSRHFPVVWCNPARPLRDLWWAAAPGDPAAAAPPGLRIYEPGRFLPLLYNPPAAARRLEAWRLRRARKLLSRAGCRTIILYLWRPEYRAALDVVPGDLSVYHIDDEYSFSPVERPLDPGEADLIRRAGLVIIHSPALMDKKGRINPETRWIPNGVDFRAFSSPQPKPPELAAIPGPVLGYAGSIKKQLDLGLLLELARRRPDWSLALVGKVEYIRGEDEALRALLAMPNVHNLGFRPMDRLPAYVQAFDVCLLPYKVDGYTKFIYPLKLHEYLAAGRPVVGTPIQTLLDFPGVVRTARGPDEWIAAVEASLAPGQAGPEAAGGRREVARKFDWDILTGRIAEALCARLGGRYPELWRAAAAASEELQVRGQA